MVSFVVVAAFLCLGRPLAAAEATSTEGPIQGDERIQVLDRLRERQRDVTAVRATVILRKQHPLLREEAVSQGTLLFRRPNQMRWEVDKPQRTIVVIDGSTLLIYHPDEKEAERRDLRADFASRAAVEFLASGMSLDITELEQRFRVDLYREDGGVVLILTPRSRWVAQALASVSIYQREEEAVPRQIVVVGRRGDRTVTILTHVTINPKFPENPFSLRLGPEVRVTEVRQPGAETGSAN
jgi:outer membrane lipoprotein-sorting protein